MPGAMSEPLNPILNPKFARLWEQVAPFTMTSPERGFALWTAVNAVIDASTPGAFVECGVWRGGSSMLVALTLLQRGVKNCELYLFDTFEGMTSPSEADIDVHGRRASDLMAGSAGKRTAELVRAATGLDEVRAAIESTGYDMRLVRFIKGDVRETLSKTQTLRICLLRLDTDFYDSTLAELRQLYPRVAQGGVLFIDDYGHWKGARQAVEDYFADRAHGYTKPVLWAFDYTGVGGVKIEARDEVEIERYDYTPPGMASPDLLKLFPHALPENPWRVDWPYLRKEVPHVWRSDSQNQTGYPTGNASFEEATCLFAIASLFRGKRGLEIGTHFGWTGAHLLAAGLNLDCVDPEFADPAREASVRAAFDAIPGKASYRLWAGLSPGIVPTARAAAPEKWSFAFIDGSHDGDGPRNDARAVLENLADDAIVVLHDLTSPFVERGLAVFHEAGFSVRLLNTMQILGVAWRGDVHPPQHVADPNVPLIFAPHLAKYL